MSIKDEYRKQDSAVRKQRRDAELIRRKLYFVECPCCNESYVGGESRDEEWSVNMTEIGDGVYECGRCFSFFALDHTSETSARLLRPEELLEVYKSGDRSNQLRLRKAFWSGTTISINGDPYKDFYNYKMAGYTAREALDLKELRRLLIMFGVDPAVTGLDFSVVDYFEEEGIKKPSQEEQPDKKRKEEDEFYLQK